MSHPTPAERLLRLRESLGLSQRELAREFEVSCGAISNWEKGTRAIPGPVLKLVNLYEAYIAEENDPNSRDQFLRKLSSGWAGRIATALKTGTHIKPSALKQSLEAGLRSFLSGHLSKDVLKSKIQVAILKRSFESIEHMKGLPLKALQILTYLTPDLAPELRAILGDLEYSGRAMAPTIAAKVIYEEFGRRPDELFAEWSPRPFAVASIGQVHRARLRSGEQVAVKVQYPDVQKSLDADFRGLTFLQHLSPLIKPMDSDVLDFIRRAVLDECDYQKEFENIEKFRSLFEGQSEIIIPRPYLEYSRRRVLTADFIEGQSLSAFASATSQEERDRAGEIIWKFTMSSQLKHGLLNADAHAGNFVFLKDRVGFLDFGRVHEVDPKTIQAYRETCVYFSLGQKDLARAAFSKLPLVADPQSFDFDAFWNMMLIQQQHGISGQCFQFSHKYIADGMRAAKNLPKDGLRLTGEILWCNCSSYGLWTIFAELGATGRWGDWTVEILG